MCGKDASSARCAETLEKNGKSGNEIAITPDLVRHAEARNSVKWD
jgi:hypothetical protein